MREENVKGFCVLAQDGERVSAAAVIYAAIMSGVTGSHGFMMKKTEMQGLS